MPIKSHACLSVLCDACGETLVNEDDCVMHLQTLAEAVTVARAMDWYVLHGPRFVCRERDAAHQALLDELMPPEPQMSGQIAIDGSVEP
ncbi:hypothetical protein ACIQVR_41085 [Streptomyces xanthochromogenes]|uniref:hypothetical protein n=1 Tax=Streptomyces xanthochromogenes TaxID=67384 RepID=UPI00382CE078